MFGFEHYSELSGKLRIEEIEMSLECAVVIYLYTKIFNRFGKITVIFDPPKGMVKFWEEALSLHLGDITKAEDF